mgnify:CR=1 FL=1
MERMEQLKAMLSLCLIFGMAFCLGSVVGHTVRVRDQAVMARPAQKDWGLSFQEDNKPPVADENMEQLAQYDAFYAENTTEKVLYLTFDCGYENGNTPAILDALKKHHVPAAFFIVGNYLEKNPDLVKRMRAEGHIIGNHSYHHPDMRERKSFRRSWRSWKTCTSRQPAKRCRSFIARPRVNTATTICSWQRSLGIGRFSGALPMWTGSRRNSRPTKRRCQSC